MAHSTTRHTYLDQPPELDFKLSLFTDCNFRMQSSRQVVLIVHARHVLDDEQTHPVGKIDHASRSMNQVC